MKKVSLAFSILLTLLLTIIGVTPASGASNSGKVNVLIGFNQPPTTLEQGLIRSLGGDVRFTYRLIPAIVASIPETALQGLLRNPWVTIIEPDVTIHAIDAELDNTWGVKRIGAGAVHDFSNKGDSVKIAVIDSGIDYTHPDLTANYAGGYDFVNGDSGPGDNNGRGTHVAGTIAALDNGLGVIGVAPEACPIGLMRCSTCAEN